MASPCPDPTDHRGVPRGPCTPTTLPILLYWDPQGSQPWIQEAERSHAPHPVPLRLHPPSSNFLSCFSFLAISFRKSLELRWPILGGGRLPPVQFWVLMGTVRREERCEGQSTLRRGSGSPHTPFPALSQG